mgnify:FL=1|tara:strand:+ start:1445 stop:2875 length:1431 start_codon:yes stop_codon:yes gene_type:complete
MITFDYIKSSNRLVINCEDKAILSQIRENFSVNNDDARFARRFNKFAPRRKYVITPNGTCELGLYWDIRIFLRENQINIDVNITDNLRSVLNVGIPGVIYNNFKFTLRDYQLDVVERALSLGRGTCVLGTGAGKTFTTAALIENFYRKAPDIDTFKCLVIVPDLGLVEQTYKEFIECGSTYKLTRWTGSIDPDLTANVIIANTGVIQSRFDKNDWIKYIDLLIVDECHRITATSKTAKLIKQIKTQNKFGFTGTLSENLLNKWAVIGRLGPVIYEKNSYELRQEDHLVNVTVKVLTLKYSKPLRYITDNKYKEELDFIYDSHDRNNFIRKVCEKLSNNTLLLVNHIKHGEKLEEYLANVTDKQVFFIRGEVEVDEREKIKQIMENSSNVICIAISAIFSTGVNVKNLHNIIFAAGGKSFIRTVQSIGRGLRKHNTKNKLVILDICDDLVYGVKHSAKRKQIYNKEKISYTEKTFNI